MEAPFVLGLANAMGMLSSTGKPWLEARRLMNPYTQREGIAAPYRCRLVPSATLRSSRPRYGIPCVLNPLTYNHHQLPRALPSATLIPSQAGNAFQITSHLLRQKLTEDRIEDLH